MTPAARFVAVSQLGVTALLGCAVAGLGLTLVLVLLTMKSVRAQIANLQSAVSQIQAAQIDRERRKGDLAD
jgi:hypothetical protein